MAEGAVLKVVAIDGHRGDGVIEPDARLPARRVFAAAADIAPDVERDVDAGVGRVGVDVDAALVVGLRDDALDDVRDHVVVVALDAHRAGEHVVEMVVRHLRAAARKVQAGGVRALPALHPGDVVVAHHHAARGQRLPVAARDPQRAQSEAAQHVAAHGGVAGVLQHHALAAEVAHHVAREMEVPAVPGHDGRRTPAFHHQSRHGEVPHAVEREERLVEERQRKAARIFRRPEVELAVRTVQPPFAGTVQRVDGVDDEPRTLGLDHHVEALAERHEPRGGIELLRRLGEVGPVVPPEAGEHEGGFVRPGREVDVRLEHPVGGIVEYLADVQPALVGETGEREAFAVRVDVRHGASAAHFAAMEAERMERRRVGVAKCPHVGADHVSARLGRQAAHDFGIQRGVKPRHVQRAGQNRPLVLPRAPDDRRAGFAGVLRTQLECGGHSIRAAM